MPIPAVPPTPYAYVVDYRPLDRCAPPGCAIDPRQLVGYADETQYDGDPGSYVRLGSGLKNELFFRRGVLLRPNETFDFTLPASAAKSELDAYVSAASADADYRVRVEIDALAPASAPVSVGSAEVSGHTAQFRHVTSSSLGEPKRYATHLRVPLPSRERRVLRVRIRNIGAAKAAVAAPLVMRRVEGRGPRQAVFAIFDAVPFHLMRAAFEGETGEAKTAWLGELVAERGVYFPHGQAPSQVTASFVSRFFGGEYWGNQGWPAMYGTGAIDEALPERLESPVARLAEQGMLTEFVGNNFFMLSSEALLGFDGGMQTEVPMHAEGMAKYVASWASDHPHDDALLVLWNTETHSPYPRGRPSPPAPLADGLPTSQNNVRVSNDVWRNLLDGIDHLEEELGSLRDAAPDAERIVFMTSDHSRGATRKFARRAYRAMGGAIGTGLSHGCASSVEEMSTPFAVIFDGAAERPAVHRVDEPASAFAMWRVIEERFGVSVDLPSTSVFFDPVFSPEQLASAWDDHGFFSVGLVGGIRAVRGDLAYGFFRPNLSAADVWSLPLREQPVLLGTPARAGSVISEELYDDAKDPYEYENLADARFDDLLSMRREVTDFVAAHYDPPTRPRKVYTLVLPRVMDVRLRAPHPFTAVVNGAPVPSDDPTTATVHASVIEIVETSEHVGVIEVMSLDRGAPMVLTCASSGLPLDALSPSRARLNLALAATNCPLPEGRRGVAAPGQILFSARKATAADGVPRSALVRVRTSGGDLKRDEFLEGMKRWGYVRDIDKKGGE